MPVLKNPKSWKRPRRRYGFDLTEPEQENVKRALRVLSVRMGGAAPLAKALGAKLNTLHGNMEQRGRPGAGIALRAARLAEVPVESILAGEWPVKDGCPCCGHPLGGRTE